MFYCFFILPAFALAQGEPHPFQNSRFLNTYVTLQQPSMQSLQNMALRDALNNIEAACHVTLWLDRRVDAGKVIDLPARLVPFKHALKK